MTLTTDDREFLCAADRDNAYLFAFVDIAADCAARGVELPGRHVLARMLGCSRSRAARILRAWKRREESTSKTAPMLDSIGAG